MVMILTKPSLPPSEPRFAVLYSLNKRHIPVGELPHKIHVRIVDHDMEMLDGVDRFQGLPILEPNNLFTWYARAESPLHVLLDLLSRFRGEVVGCGVVLEIEFDPNN